MHDDDDEKDRDDKWSLSDDKFPLLHIRRVLTPNKDRTPKVNEVR